eukprot:TRINITY_DN8499_c0_g8_i1.p1 TRINITY_DN8499_c0_g8~~TRINITY_DN8499_c0_g8_i1.p1  ORF type:complete len:5046 (+),score=966.34 TRINITY_DN8499_c0_g8_i1:123-15260(+)
MVRPSLTGRTMQTSLSLASLLILCLVYDTSSVPVEKRRGGHERSLMRRESRSARARAALAQVEQENFEGFLEEASSDDACYEPHAECADIMGSEGFLWQGKMQKECIEDQGRYWCAIKGTQLTELDWRPCSRCHSCGVPDPTCHSGSWTYYGQRMQGCTLEGAFSGDQPWCSTVASFDDEALNKKDWASCKRCSCRACMETRTALANATTEEVLVSEDAEGSKASDAEEDDVNNRASCWLMPYDCVPQYDYHGQKYQGCTNAESPEAWWCSKADRWRSADDTSFCIMKEECKGTPAAVMADTGGGGDCWRPSHLCVHQFRYGEQRVRGCTRVGGRDNSTTPWCSTHAVLDETNSSAHFERCVKVPCETCWLKSDKCIGNWTYTNTGEVVEDCITAASTDGEGWCSTEDKYRDGDKTWASCRQCQAEADLDRGVRLAGCWKPAATCAPMFVFDRISHKGCMEDKQGQAWCSEDYDATKFLKCTPCGVEPAGNMSMNASKNASESEEAASAPTVEPLTAATSPMLAAMLTTTWMEATSETASATAAGASTFASCPVGLSLTGCGCFSKDGSCAGVRSDGSSCVALNKKNGTGVWAEIRCGLLPGASGWSDLQSKLMYGDHSQVTCPMATSLLSCTCYSTSGACAGAKAIGRKCTAYRHQAAGEAGDAAAVFAQARCAAIPGSKHWQSAVSSLGTKLSLQGGSEGMPGVNVSCPQGTKLLSCSCWSDEGICVGARSKDNTCSALATIGARGGVQARARCATIPRGDRWCWSADSMLTTCKAIPAAKMAAPAEVSSHSEAKNSCQLLGERCGGVLVTPNPVSLLAFQGCFLDDGTHDQFIAADSSYRPEGGRYSPKRCAEACAADGFAFIALQREGLECSCGNSYGSRPKFERLPDSDCGLSCGDSPSVFQPCGKKLRSAIYRVKASPSVGDGGGSTSAVGSKEAQEAANNYELALPWKDGLSSECSDLGCDFKSDGLAQGLVECQEHCEGTDDCNTINFCPEGASCGESAAGGVGYCCRRVCSRTNNFELDFLFNSRNGGFDVYTKKTAEKLLRDGPNVSSDVANLACLATQSTFSEARVNCNMDPACQAILSEDCGISTGWVVCRKTIPEMLAWRSSTAASADVANSANRRTACTKAVVQEGYTWLPCIGHCVSEDGSSTIQRCPEGSYLTEVSVFAAGGFLQIAGGTCNDGSKLKNGGGFSVDEANAEVKALSQNRGAVGITVNAGLGLSSFKKITYMAFGTCSSASTTCPSECKAPGCTTNRQADAESAAELINGSCLFRCSEPRSGIRHCGLGDAYEKEGSVDCTGCRSCPAACKAPAVASGNASKGGEVMDNVCKFRASAPEDGIRRCGTGAAFEGDQSVDCAACAYEAVGPFCETGTLTEASGAYAHYECPRPRQRLAGWRVSGAKGLRGIELYCAELPPTRPTELPCHGNCSKGGWSLPVAMSCPAGAYLTRMDVTYIVNQRLLESEGKASKEDGSTAGSSSNASLAVGAELVHDAHQSAARALYIRGGVCSDGSRLSSGADVGYGMCGLKGGIRKSLEASQGTSAVLVNSRMSLTHLKLKDGCTETEKEAASCELGQRLSEAQLTELRCPEPLQKLAGWEISAACEVQGLRLKCMEPTPVAVGWLPCHGSCLNSRPAGFAQTCPEGAFLTSFHLKDNGLNSLFPEGGRCSDGTILDGGLAYTCPQEEIHSVRLTAPRGTRSWSMPRHLGQRLSYFKFGECSYNKCEYGWVAENGAQEFHCPLAVQRVAGWRVHTDAAGCHITGMEFYCADVVQPVSVDKVTYCQPDSFNTTSTEPAETAQDKSTAYLHWKCTGVCNTYVVDGGGLPGVKGHYRVAWETLSDGKPVWNLNADTTLLRKDGQWRLEKQGVTLFNFATSDSQASADAELQDAPPPGRWQAASGTTAAPPTVNCNASSAHAQTDPCWKPHKACLPEFLYKGTVYQGCTKVDSNQHWCGLESVTGALRWALCTDDLECRAGRTKEGAQALAQKIVEPADAHICWRPAKTCKNRFFYKGATYSGCAVDHNDGSHWCSEDTNFQDGASGWKRCSKVLCAHGAQMNVALHKNVTTSSQRDEVALPELLVTDGESAAGFQDASKCFFTGEGSPNGEFIQIDLGHSFKVSKLVMVGLADDQAAASRGLKLTVGDAGDASDMACAENVDDAGGSPRTLSCSFAAEAGSYLKGRFVTVRSNKAIALCELQAWARVCWRPHPDCVSEFEFEDTPGEAIGGCTLGRSSTPWCSTESVFTGGSRPCEMVPCKKEKPTSKFDPMALCTQPHQECSPVFEMLGETYGTCTTAGVVQTELGKKNSYCSVKRLLDPSRFNLDQRPCKEVPCNGCHVREEACVSTFQYQGVNYTGCTNVGSDVFWCSLDEVYNGSTSRRKMCKSCSPEPMPPPKKVDFIHGWPSDASCWAPKTEANCVSDFMVDNTPVHGCTTRKFHRPWCSKTENFTGQWDICEPCLDCWRPHPNCVPLFEYDGRTVVGCHDTGAHTPWCSRTDKFQGAWEECIKCAGIAPDTDPQARYWSPAALCQASFTYKGLTYNGCTKADADRYWCGKSAVVIEGDANYEFCEQLPGSTSDDDGDLTKAALLVDFQIGSVSLKTLNTSQRLAMVKRLGEQLASRISVPSNSITVELKDGSPSAGALTERQAEDASHRSRQAPDGESGSIRAEAKVKAQNMNLELTQGLLRSNDTASALSDALASLPELHGLPGNASALRISNVHSDHVAALQLPNSSCWIGPAECAPVFTYAGKVIQGCTNQDYHRQWCSMDAVYSGRSTVCKQVRCDECWTPAWQCAKQFTFQGRSIQGCTTLSSNQHWCSLDSEFVLQTGRWALCQQCKPGGNNAHGMVTESVVEFDPAPDCVPAFTYKGKAYSGCTQEDHVSYWCSTVETLEDGSLDWRLCTKRGNVGNELVTSETSEVASCFLPAESCVPQFTYGGSRYQGCAKSANDGPRWCSRDRTFRQGSGAYEVCSQVPCSQCWVRDPVCQASFEYNGKTYSGCAPGVNPGDRGWCSIAKTFEDGSGRWRWCSRCDITEAPSRQQMCYQPTSSCVSEFIYRGKMYAGCTRVDSDMQWCSKTRDLKERTGSTDVCKEVPCDKCWIRDPSCLSAFEFEGEQVEGCLSKRSASPWCSKGYFADGTLDWGHCMQCQAPSEIEADGGSCYQPDSECVSEFAHAGRLYVGCTSRDAEFQWCSQDRDTDLYSRWKICERVACDDCYLRDSSCAKSFTYKGKVIVGCTKEDSAVSWCSLDENYEAATGRWAECLPCQRKGARDQLVVESKGAGKRCQQPHPGCVGEFIYKGKLYRGCTNADSLNHWCSRSRYYEGPKDGRELCTPTPCDQCFFRSPLCRESFTYAGKQYSGCTNTNSDSWWCSRDAEFVHLSGSFSACTPCMQGDLENQKGEVQELCYEPATTCAKEFQYKGITYKGCTRVDSDVSWCSLDRFMTEKSNRFLVCKEVPCVWSTTQSSQATTKRCTSPDPRCEPTFRYQGKTRRGCIFDGAAEPWCSLHKEYHGSDSAAACQLVPCKDCWIRSEKCVPSFTRLGTTFLGCTKAGSQQHWCSHDTTFLDESSMWSTCSPCEESHISELESCWEPAEDCVPQFFMDGKMVFGCTGTGRCAMSRTANSLSMAFGACIQKPCSNCWVRDPSCQAQWTYQGQTYRGCQKLPTPDGRNTGVAWCSIDGILEEGGRWAFCEGCQHASGGEQTALSMPSTEMSSCWKPAADCVQPFLKDGRPTTGCVVEAGGGSAWCSRTAEYETVGSAAADKLPCTQTRCDDVCWQPPQSCVQPFLYQGSSISGCIRTAGMQPWCATAADADAQPAARQLCRQTSCEQVCYAPASACVQPFWYSGKKYSGCTTDGHSQHWCSTVPNLPPNSSQWTLCRQIECDQLCWQPADDCVQPFRTTEGNTTSAFVRLLSGQRCAAGRDIESEEDCALAAEALGMTMANSSARSRLVDLPAGCVQTSEKLFFSNIGGADAATPTASKEDVLAVCYNSDAESGCITNEGSSDAWCSTKSIADRSSNESRALCKRTDCKEVCWKRAISCLRQFTYLNKTFHGCVTDPEVLKGRRPWCSETESFDEGSRSMRYCSQVPCTEAECEGPQCEGFGLFKVPDGRCVVPAPREASEKMFGLVLSSRCKFPDYNGFMVKEVESEYGYFLLRHISGRCVQPKKHKATDEVARLMVGETCAEMDSMRFKRINIGGFHVLKHSSGRCVDLVDSSIGEAQDVVLSRNCPEGPAGSPKAALPQNMIYYDASRRHPRAVAKKKPAFAVRAYPRPCQLGDWGDWTTCSASCASGSKSRRREVVAHQEDGGVPCTGERVEEITCGRPCPVDCVLGDWNTWTACNKACGGGEQTRTKVVLVAPAHGGSACNSPKDTMTCNPQPCPEPCKWGAWQSWGSCSTTCGGGTRFRSKPIAAQPVNGGKPCEDPPTNEQGCGMAPCPQHCSLGQWQDWSDCSRTCGGGVETRRRLVSIEPMHGGKECGNNNGQSRVCSQHPCPVDCIYKAWTDWSECTATCGGGHRFRSHETVEPLYGGYACHPERTSRAMCSVAPCPVNCRWGVWTEWTVCSQTCDGGEKVRQREQLQVARHGGAPCIGEAREEPKCNTMMCPSDCQWDSWDQWTACGTSCGGGLRKRERREVSKAKNGGNPCTGSKKQSVVCNSDACPIDCNWYTWSPFTACTQTCGGGRKTRSRQKRTLTQNGGLACAGNQEEAHECGSEPCPIDCHWDSWGDWAPCSQTCGSGKKTRMRAIKVYARNRGKACEGSPRQDEVCNYEACAVDCIWKVWDDWSECTKTCGTGLRKRARQHFHLAQHGGRHCKGTTIEEGVCNTRGCPIDCQWFEWDLWHTCTKTCGGGDRMRERQKRQAAAQGGQQCVGAYKEHQACGTWDCPVNCKWGEWSPWSKCSKSCGGGKRSRKRAVEIPGQAGGIQCRGDPQAYQLTQWCQTNPCPDDYGWMPPTRKQTLQAQDAGDVPAAAIGESDKNIIKAMIGSVFGIVLCIGCLAFAGLSLYERFADYQKDAEEEDEEREDDEGSGDAGDGDEDEDEESDRS